MTLIKCPECRKEISDKAKVCPNCGYSIKKNFDFKKYGKKIGKLGLIGSIICLVLTTVTRRDSLGLSAQQYFSSTPLTTFEEFKVLIYSLIDIVGNIFLLILIIGVIFLIISWVKDKNK